MLTDWPCKDSCLRQSIRHHELVVKISEDFWNPLILHWSSLPGNALPDTISANQNRQKIKKGKISTILCQHIRIAFIFNCEFLLWIPRYVAISSSSIRLSVSVREVASSSPVRSNALVKVECAWNSPGQGTHCSLLIVSLKLVRNSRSWSGLRWLIMVWIGYSAPCSCSILW